MIIATQNAKNYQDSLLQMDIPDYWVLTSVSRMSLGTVIFNVFQLTQMLVVHELLSKTMH